MKKTFFFISIFIFFLFYSHSAVSQLSFNMSDTIVTECKGRLYDNGGSGANYSHNANITFTICLNNPAPITLSFISFCVESEFDSLRIFDGPTTNAPQLGPTLWGNSVPASVTSTSGCMTLNFRSDANVACFGWIADWTTEIIPPIPPNITASTALPTCEQTAINVNFSETVLCDSVFPGAFTLTGPSTISIANAIPANCSNGNTTAANLTINPGLDVGGIYVLTYTFHHLDACDSLWTFYQTDTIEVFDCPIEVEIIATSDSLCADQCTYITAVATGGNGQYSYSWSNGLPPTAGPHLVCPGSSTQYTVTVDDTSPAIAANATKNITMFPKTLAGNDFTICQSSDEITLNGSPVGGVWFGQGITDKNLGIFNPDSSAVGYNEIEYAFYYSSTFYCSDTLIAEVRPIDAGPDQAACPGTSAFQLTGNSPTGGTWSGPFTDVSGIFDPTTQGEYEVVYTFDGCTDSKTVFVDLISNTPSSTDSICQSNPEFNFNLSPSGGIWSGNGIVDTLSGLFNADEAGGGLHQITYALNGCEEQFDIFVKSIDAGEDFSACPSETPFEINDFSPSGGTWSGDGILDSESGLFDPGFNNGDFNASLVYITPDGCTDTIIGNIRKTFINEEFLRFCASDDPIVLRFNSVGNIPSGGDWTGTGVTQALNGNYLFNPAIAGQGVHWLTYTANTCADSLQMIVYDEMLIPVNGVCELNPPFQLPIEAYAVGGTFSGSGIIDADQGIFSPTVAGAGNHEITYTSPNGCSESITIEVGDFSAAIINPIDPICFKDTLINLQANPPGGVFSGIGVVENTFNPILANEGSNTIEYLLGEGFCQATSTLEIIVFPKVNHNILVSKDSLCEGEFSNISINAFGGMGGIITYNWNNDLSPGSQQIVSPNVSTQYIINISDGCTVITDTVEIFVAPNIEYSLNISPIVCYGSPSTASVDNLGADYDVVWQSGNEVFTGNELNGSAGIPYNLTVSDPETSCKKDTTFILPAHPPLTANFLISPGSNGCLEYSDKNISIIDLSVGGTNGTWDMGDQNTYEYAPFQSLSHEFDEPGSFNINLLIFDDFGCKDTYTQSLCILDRSSVYIPNSFTPNDDSRNDNLMVFGSGIKKIDVFVYDRRGILMAHATELGVVWDGNRPDGRRAMKDVYTYLIELTWDKGTFFTKTGTVTLIP